MILLDVDPNWVRPGWTPLFVTLLLAAAMVFLYFSMRKQFRKIRASDDIAKEAEDAVRDDNDSAPLAEESASERPPGSSG
jgi:hypothetical protein